MLRHTVGYAVGWVTLPVVLVLYMATTLVMWVARGAPLPLAFSAAVMTSPGGAIGRRNASWRLPVVRFGWRDGSSEADASACPKRLSPPPVGASPPRPIP